MTLLEYESRNRKASPGSRIKRILLVCAAGVLLFPLIVLPVHLIALVLPFGWEATAYLAVPTTEPDSYGGTAEFNISAFGSGRGSWTELEWAWLIYGAPVANREARVDLRTLTFYEVDPVYGGGVSPRPLSRDVLEKYAIGVGIAEGEARAVAEMMDAELRKLGAGILPPDVTGRSNLVPTRSIYYEMKAFDDLAEPAYLLLGDVGGALFWWPWHLVISIPAWLLAWRLAGLWLLRRISSAEN